MKPIGQMSGSERLAFYSDQARFAWADGLLSAKDRQILNLARERIGLTLEEAQRLERAAMRAAPGAA